MNTIILSIKPEYTKLILNKKKKVEFRSWKPHCSLPFKVIIYASKPVGEIVGEFIVSTILEDDIESLWNLTKNIGGIKRESYLRYFKDNGIGYAFSISCMKQYRSKKKLSDYGLVKAPQRFAYIKKID